MLSNEFGYARRLAVGLTGIAMIAFTVISCTRRSQQQLEYGLPLNDTIRINVQTEPPSLDWNKATDTTSNDIFVNVMDALARYNMNDPKMSVEPGLAVSWTPSDGAKTWTLKLREGVVWSDGVPFEASQVLDGWERLLNPATASEYSYFLYSIVNGREYNSGKVKDFSKVGVKAIDKYTIEVKLTTPKSFFPFLISHHSTCPIRKDLIAKFGDKWTEAGNLQSLGPYTLKTWDHDKAIVLERNEKYWGEKAHTKYVLVYMINETSTAVNLVDSGKIDIQVELPSTELASLSKRKDFRQNSNLSIQFYGFNVRKPPFNNANLRKAVVAAIDRNEITTLLNGGQSPLMSWVPMGMMGYEPDRGIRFDVAKAKEYLKEAGYSDPKKIPKIVLAFNTNDNHKRVAENVQAQLKRNLGIDIELQNQEWKVYLSSLKTDPPNIYRMGWNADYPDPDNFMNLMTSYSENNRTGWKNKTYDEYIEKAAAELDTIKRLELYSKAEKLLVEDEAPVIPLFTRVLHYLVSDRIQNYKLNILEHQDLSKVEIKK